MRSFIISFIGIFFLVLSVSAETPVKFYKHKIDTSSYKEVSLTLFEYTTQIKTGKYIPEDHPCKSTDEVKLIFIGFSNVKDEEWVMAMKTSPKIIIKKKKEISFADRKAKKLFFKLTKKMPSEKAKNFKKIVQITARKHGQINVASIKELATHSI